VHIYPLQALAWFPDTAEGKQAKETACRWLVALAKSSMVRLLASGADKGESITQETLAPDWDARSDAD